MTTIYILSYSLLDYRDNEMGCFWLPSSEIWVVAGSCTAIELGLALLVDPEPAMPYQHTTRTPSRPVRQLKTNATMPRVVKLLLVNG